MKPYSIIFVAIEADHYFWQRNEHEMITGFTHLHSSFRYLVLIFIILAVVDAVTGLSSGRAYRKSSKLFALLGLIFSHIQLLFGLLLYFLGGKGFQMLMNADNVMKEPLLRFYAVEHISMMIIAIALVTIGYSRAKKHEEARRKFRSVLIFYGIALVIIFIMIPWPFLKSFGSWI